MTASTAPLSAAGRELPKRWLAIIATIWGGQAASMITSYAAGYAVVWYITETTGSAIMLAAAAICAYLPQGLLSPFGGVIADKYNRKTVMIVADLSVGIVSLGLGIVILFGQVSFPLLMILVIVRSIGQAFHGPAMMAAMPLLVPEKHLLRINTLDQLLMSVASIGAPAFGNLPVHHHRVPLRDVLDCRSTRGRGGLALAKIPTVADETAENQHKAGEPSRRLESAVGNPRTRHPHRRHHHRHDGVRPVGGHLPARDVRPLRRRRLHGVRSGSRVRRRMIAGSIVLMAWGGGKRLAGLIAVASLIVGVTTTACGFLAPTMFWAFVALCAVMALACSWFNGPLITLIQRNVPEEKTGRALGLAMAAMGLASPVGIAIGGVAAEAMGVAAFFVADGLVCIALGLTVYLFKSVRALDHDEPHVLRDSAAEANAEIGTVSEEG